MSYPSNMTFDVLPIKHDICCQPSNMTFDVLPLKHDIWCLTLQEWHLLSYSSNMTFVVLPFTTFVVLPLKHDIWCLTLQTWHLMSYPLSMTFDVLPFKHDIWCLTLQAWHLMSYPSNMTFVVSLQTWHLLSYPSSVTFVDSWFCTSCCSCLSPSVSMFSAGVSMRWSLYGVWPSGVIRTTPRLWYRAGLPLKLAVIGMSKKWYGHFPFLLIKLKFQWPILSKFNISISVVNGPFYCSMCQWPHTILITESVMLILKFTRPGLPPPLFKSHPPIIKLAKSKTQTCVLNHIWGAY